MYGFVWRNVGHLSDDFFGTFLAFLNTFLSLYFACFVTAASEYDKTALFKVCWAKQDFHNNGQQLLTAFDTGGMDIFLKRQ